MFLIAYRNYNRRTVYSKFLTLRGIYRVVKGAPTQADSIIMLRDFGAIYRYIDIYVGYKRGEHAGVSRGNIDSTPIVTHAFDTNGPARLTFPYLVHYFSITVC